MSAKDYKICPALFNAYIAKVSKKNPNKMLEDRREITEQEIIELIVWWMKRTHMENEHTIRTITANGKTVIQLEYFPENDNDE
jgi:hypothetical protein